MTTRCKRRKPLKQRGIALLIAIFVLLLVCVAGIAMVVASGTDSALAGNYHSSTDMYYAAVAGLEEGRGRVWSRSPDYVDKSVPGFLPSPGTLPIGNVLYIENPAGALGTYPDTEYANEFANPPATVTTTPSVSPIAGLPGGLYKWVRVNAVTERALNLDINNDGVIDNTTPLYYDGSKLNLTNTGFQALEITSIAAAADGSRKILQYVVAPTSLNLSFPAAITLDGNNVEFTGPTSTSFNVDGNDQCAAAPTVTGIGYTNSGDSSYNNIVSGNVVTNKSHYTGSGATTPSVNSVVLPPTLTSVTGLNNLVQTLKDNADVVIPGGSTQSDLTNWMPASMSSTHPVIAFADGNLTINAWHATGYGILVVTGDLTYDPDASWDGLVLVIGTGYLNSHQGGPGQFTGAMFLARTVDAGGIPLAPGDPLGQAFFNFTDTAVSAGIKYSSCWVSSAQPPLIYKVLSFREVAQ